MITRLLRIFRRPAPDCPEVRAAASEYIDGELDAKVYNGISSHLRRCGPCLSFINTLRTTVELLRLTPVSNPPEGYTNRLLDTLGRPR